MSKPTELRIVDDQTGCPTSAADIATVMLAITKKAESKDFCDWGTYHVAGADPVTWYGFATLIFEEAAGFGVRVPELRAISSAEFWAPAPRPAYSVLNTSKLRGTFGLEPKPLRESLVQCLKRLLGKTNRSHRYDFSACD